MSSQSRKNALHLCLAMLILALLQLSPVQAASIDSSFNVDTTTDSYDANPGDGICADSNGDCSLRAAIEEANAVPQEADTITLPAGTYLLANGTLEITSNLTINGDGLATTIIDAQLIDRVFTMYSNLEEPINVYLFGMTIKNGYTSSDGGGIYSEAFLTIVNVVIENNFSAYAGGGIDSASYDLTVIDSLIQANTTNGNGGAIIHSWGLLSIENSAITNNWATDGGGIYNHDQATIIDSVIQNNTSEDDGAGIFNSGTLTITQTTIAGNDSESTGGGIYSTDGFVWLIDSKISGNQSVSSGGGIHFSGEFFTLTIDGSTISGNQAGSNGGGINTYSTNSGPTVNIKDSTLSGNTADRSGGGIYTSLAYLTIDHSTIADNIADANNDGDGDGGGLYDLYTDGSVVFRGTILASNSDSGGQAPDCGGAGIYTSLDYNLIQDTTGCLLASVPPHDILGQPALLGPLADNGGDTFTHALLTGSPAIEAGTCIDSDGALVTADQRGQPRPMGPLCDIGAYEYGGLSLFKHADDPTPLAGQPVVFAIVTGNGLTTSVTGAVISDSLPTGLIFAGPISLNPPEAGVPGTQPPVLVSDLTILPGQFVTVTLPVTVSGDLPPGTLITNTAWIATPGGLLPASGTRVLLVCTNESTVTSSSDNGPGSLREAIANTCAGGTIDFDLPVPVTITLTNGELLIDKTLTINGPGSANLAVSGDHNSRVFNVSGQGVILNGLTIRDGVNDTQGGGGIFNSGSLRLEDNIVINNQVQVYFPSGSGGGGGIYNSGVITIDNSLITNNLASVWFLSGGGGGGGIYNSGTLTITASTFFSNTAESYGGGGGALCNDGGLVTLILDLIQENHATGGSSYGGAIHTASESTTIILNSTIISNTAENSGGGLNTFYGTYIISNSLISNNRAIQYDGGGFNNVGTVYITNSTISNNFANNDGGALWSESSETYSDNVTFADNSALHQGDEIYLHVANVYFRNTIISGSFPDDDCAGSYPLIFSLGYNLSRDGSCDLNDPTDLINTDPLLGPLADYGGETLTHALLAGSPAIDAGSCTGSGGNRVLVDQRGVTRPQGNACDIGAYEVDKLSLWKTIDEPRPVPGQRVIYTLTISNGSNTPLMNAVLSDTLPAGITFAGPIVLDPPGSGTVGTIPPLLAYDLTTAPGEVVTVTFPVTVETGLPASTTITNTAVLTNTEGMSPLMGYTSLIVANLAPQATADNYTTTMGTRLSITAPGILENDLDLNGDQIFAVLNDPPTHGTLLLQGDGSLVYTPTVNFNGADLFTYQANDGTVASTPANVIITVNVQQSSYPVYLPMVLR
jgi:uncharacterized repeat protein (TIGR01451 family)/CSLREA domain-containing protein